MVVYARERKETATQYVVTAQDLQVAVIKYMMNEKRVPKKWRYMLARGAMNTVSILLDNVIAAHVIYPNTEEKLEQRKEYLNQAIINTHQLQNRLLCMVRTIETVNAENLGEITKLMFDEIALLKTAIKNCRIVKQKEV